MKLFHTFSSGFVTESPINLGRILISNSKYAINTSLRRSYVDLYSLDHVKNFYTCQKGICSFKKVFLVNDQSSFLFSSLLSLKTL